MTDFVQNTLSIRLLPRRSWFSLGPGWAVMGSLLAVGIFSLNSMHLIQLIILWLLVDPVLGTIWQLTVNDGVLQNLEHKAQANGTPIKALLPYTGQNSLGYRISVGVSYLRTQNDGVWQTLLLLSFLALALSAFLGWQIFVYGLLCLGLAPIVVYWPSTHAGRQFLQTTFLFAFPFAAGLFLLNGLNRNALALGILYSLIYWGVLRLGAGQFSGARLVITGQAVAAIFLFAHLQPIGAMITALSAVFSALFHNQAGRTEPPAWRQYLHHLQPVLLFGFLAATFALGMGG